MRGKIIFKRVFYEELEKDFDNFHKYHMKILLAYFNAKVGREYFQSENWE